MLFKNSFVSRFVFSRSEQSGILLLVLIIACLLLLKYRISWDAGVEAFDLDSEEICLERQRIDSLQKLALERAKPKLYPFNPNFITDYKAYLLGLSTEEFDRLQAYRAKGKWVNSKADFKGVTQVSEEWLDSIAPYFKFPSWVNQPKKSFKEKTWKQSPAEKSDLNSASKEDLMTVNGVGAILSERIIQYREKLGGFSSDAQLNAVYGLSPQTIERILQQFTVQDPSPLQQMNINSISASDIATIPGISFELAKDIWEFVRLREGLTNIEELQNFAELSPQKFRLIQLYLYAE